MHTVLLDHHDVKVLRERIRELELFIDQLTPKETKSVSGHERQHVPTRMKGFLDRIQSLKTQNDSLLEREKLMRAILHDIDDVVLTREERLVLDRELMSMRRSIESERKTRVIALTQEDMENEEVVGEELTALEHLRSDMKHFHEIWKKARAASGCDFAQAMEFTDLIEEEKTRIRHIERLIADLEARIHLS
jgi:hypothetical protein